MNASQRLPPAPTRLWRWAVLAVVVAGQAAFLFYRSSKEEARARAMLDAAKTPADLQPIEDAAPRGDHAPSRPGELVLWRGENHVSALATDGERVYFGQTYGKRVLSVPVTGGAEVILGEASFPLDLALGKDALFVLDKGDSMREGLGAILALPKEPGAEARTLATKIVWAGALAASDTHVYWLDHGSLDRDYADGLVARAPVGGGPSTLLAAGERMPTAITLDATHVYWGRNLRQGMGELVRMPLAGGRVEVLSPGQGNIRRIIVVGQEVYWVSARDFIGNGAVIRKAPVTGGPGLDVLEAKHGICDMALDEEAIYWSDPHGTGSAPSSRGRIVKTSRKEGASVVLARELSTPCRIAIDATSVYFETRDEARLRKVPKSPPAPLPFEE
ncbi:hypothetical protein GF068_05110 [Polyangium spumosum]|uniref:DUF5050 domain-containing protein n=1 Tax=Polyangium spumosum TaxID=889282 RepID=A0A6N7PMC5_9BACT|nr:hypothetical protein [Polyangium spumosum]